MENRYKHNGQVHLKNQHVDKFALLTEEERINTDKWLSMLNQIYDDLNYSPSQRVAYTVQFLNDEQKSYGMNNIRTMLRKIGQSFREQFKATCI